MAGWAIFVGLAFGAALLLWRLQFPLVLRTFGLAAIMLGAAGYAWQGRPSWAGSPTQPARAGYAIDDATLELRSAMFGRYGATAAYLIPADALLRFGAADAAAAMLQGGIRREPGNVALWTQLGTVIATRDRAVSPAAGFAFRRAIALAPTDPAPWYFWGLAQLRAGQLDATDRAWRRSIALTPTDYSYRPAIVARLAMLTQLRAIR